MDEEWRNMANFGKDAETTGKSEAFGIYEEALQMISYCTARKLENEGEYARAIEQYNQNPLFKDSQARSLNCLYLLAAESMEKEEFGKALELYQQLGDYRDSGDKAAEIQPHSYEKVHSGHSGCFAVYNSELCKWGFIDMTGKLIIPCEWDRVDSFNDGFARVKEGG